MNNLFEKHTGICAHCSTEYIEYIFKKAMEATITCVKCKKLIKLFVRRQNVKGNTKRNIGKNKK